MSLSRTQFVQRAALIAVMVLLIGGIFFLRRQTDQVVSIPLKETLRHDLVQNEGRWYLTGQTNLFTGVMVDYYPEGMLLARAQISNGLLNGVSETWFTNGQMQVRENFKEGMSDGVREKWFENGAMLSRAAIVAGKVTGTFQSWYENGQLNEQIEMKSGQPDGVAWAYYPSGFLKAETTVAAGQVINRKTWKDGEQKSAP